MEVEQKFKNALHVKKFEKFLGTDISTLSLILEEGFYGTAYGESKDIAKEIIFVDNHDFSIIIKNDIQYLLYNRSYPDGNNRYFLKDYGITWALTKEELKN